MTEESAVTKMDWADFLALMPPDSAAHVTKLCESSNPGYWNVETPDIKLYCESEHCTGHLFFKCFDGKIWINAKSWNFGFLYYRCRNCQMTLKTFALAVKQNTANSTEGKAIKVGEMPAFGPHTPPRLIKLIGPDRELFLKGRRADNRGLGIGAFAYYRRVVENQKGRIFEQIAKVAHKLGADPKLLEELKKAASETQFSKAIDQIKHGIPESLLVDGHNPLTLLHTALSDGMHDRTDEECLEVAQEIRVVLTELAERLSTALKQDAELTTAVSKLLARRSAKPQSSEITK